MYNQCHDICKELLFSSLKGRLFFKFLDIDNSSGNVTECLRRIRQRARKGEDEITSDYLELIQSAMDVYKKELPIETLIEDLDNFIKN